MFISTSIFCDRNHSSTVSYYKAQKSWYRWSGMPDIFCWYGSQIFFIKSPLSFFLFFFLSLILVVWYARHHLLICFRENKCYRMWFVLCHSFFVQCSIILVNTIILSINRRNHPKHCNFHEHNSFYYVIHHRLCI